MMKAEGYIDKINYQASNGQVEFQLDPAAPFQVAEATGETSILFRDDSTREAIIISTDTLFRIKLPSKGPRIDINSLFILKANRMKVRVIVGKPKSSQRSIVVTELVVL
jgi:hypothetical protein